MSYASRTDVTQDRSRHEIERTLERYGADQFLYGWSGADAFVKFRMAGRMISLQLIMPTIDQFMETDTGRTRKLPAARKEWEQTKRQRWRALALVVKAKLEAVASGIATFEDEFLAYTVLPDGQTAGDFLRPQIATVYESGKMPLALPGIGGTGKSR